MLILGTKDLVLETVSSKTILEKQCVSQRPEFHESLKGVNILSFIRVYKGLNGFLSIIVLVFLDISSHLSQVKRPRPGSCLCLGYKKIFCASKGDHHAEQLMVSLKVRLLALQSQLV